MKWRAFPLHPDTPEEGLSLEDLFRKKGMQVDVADVVAQLQATAARFGLPMGDRKQTFNSRLAQELGLLAESLGKGHEFHIEAFAAYFVRGDNLAKRPVLLSMAEAVGLDKAEAAEVLDQRSFSEAVDADWELSQAKGVTAVPTFFMGLDRLVGAQSHEILERMVVMYAGPKKG